MAGRATAGPKVYDTKKLYSIIASVLAEKVKRGRGGIVSLRFGELPLSQTPPQLTLAEWVIEKYFGDCLLDSGIGPVWRGKRTRFFFRRDKLLEKLVPSD